MDLGAGERGLGNHACPSFSFTLDPTSPSLLLGTTGTSLAILDVRQGLFVQSPSPRRICFVGVWVSAERPKKRPPPPPPLFRHLSLLHAPIDPRISKPKHAAPEAHPVFSCEAGNSTLFCLPDPKVGGPGRSSPSCRYGNRTRGRGGRREKKLRTKAGTRMGASDNVGSAVSGCVLAGLVGPASTVGRAEWLVGRGIRPSEARAGLLAASVTRSRSGLVGYLWRPSSIRMNTQGTL